jgi:acyl-CoA reductase-like NAD-dependent aldehyde dehydrogenase
MMKKSLFLAGEFIETPDTITVTDPYSGQIIAAVCAANEKIAADAVDRALDARKAMDAFSSGELSAILMNIAGGLAKRSTELTDLIIAEAGKPKIYARGEVSRAVETFKIAAEECKRLPHEIIDLDWTSAGKGKQGKLVYRSTGVALGISPFNFPLNLVAHKAAPAIAARSPIILKPSSVAPLSALLLSEIVAASSLPHGAFSVLPCPRSAAQTLVEHDRIAVVSFTGSPAVGWELKTRAGKKKVVLELGGNAAAIVHKDADMDAALQKLIVGGFAYSGQVCIHTQRILVHESLYPAFLERYADMARVLPAGDPRDEQTRISVMIDEKNAVRVMDWLAEAIENGAAVVTGAAKAGGDHHSPATNTGLERIGSYVPPTVVTGAGKGMKIWNEEVFGPLVCLRSYTDIDEAIELVNESRFGLQAALFSDSRSVIERCFRLIEVGALIVNDATTFRVDHMPYGGVKDSGFGREGVKYAMMDYLEPRLLVG